MKRKKLSDLTVDEGLYVLPSGRFAVIWREHGRPHEKHFPADTPRKALREFRKSQTTRVAQAAPTNEDETGSFVRDTVTFLRTRRARPSYASDRSHMKPWIKVFGRFSRHAVTAAKITAALTLDGWATKSPREVRHRVNTLRQFFNFHDGARFTDALFADVVTPKVPTTEPVGVADTVIAAVAARLADHQRRGYLRDGKTRARFLVEATCGKRPCQIAAARPAHLDLDGRVWNVQPAKGSRGGRLYLNDQMVAAWRAFVAADAWGTDAEGTWDRRSFVKTLQRNGWPEGIRPYNMRHQTLQVMTDRGVDFGEVQGVAGHTSPDTTRRHYVPMTGARRASEAVEGRFDAAMFAPVVRAKPPRRRRGSPPAPVEGATSIPSGYTIAADGRAPNNPEKPHETPCGKPATATPGADTVPILDAVLV